MLRGEERVGTVLPGRHPVWADEFWWDSNPPNAVSVGKGAVFATKLRLRGKQRLRATVGTSTSLVWK